MQRLFSAGIIIFFARGTKREYLLLQYAAGHWDLPKGKIEKGETKEQAALRELEEETGLTARIILGFQETLAYWFKGYKKGDLVHKTVYFFIGRTSKKKVFLSDEHISYVWLPYKKAVEALSYKNAKQILQKAERFLNKSV